VGPFDDNLFAELTAELSAEEKGNRKFDDIFIGSQLARLDFFSRRKFNIKAYEEYVRVCKMAKQAGMTDAEACDVLESAITNLVDLGEKWPIPLAVRGAIIAEQQKRAATHGPIFSEKSNSIPSPEDAELYRRNAEYVDVHFPGVAMGDVHTDQDERFYKARQTNPKLRGQVEIGFLMGSIEEREKILTDPENLATGPPDYLRRPGEPEKQKRTAAPALAPRTSTADSVRVILVMERKIQELEGKLSAALDRVAELESTESLRRLTGVV
jgi:hypothetical protein